MEKKFAYNMLNTEWEVVKFLNDNREITVVSIIYRANLSLSEARYIIFYYTQPTHQ